MSEIVCEVVETTSQLEAEPKLAKNSKWVDPFEHLPKPGEMVLAVIDGNIHSVMLEHCADDDSYYWWCPIAAGDIKGVEYWRPIADGDLPEFERPAVESVATIKETESEKLAAESFDEVPGPILDAYGDWISVGDRLPKFMARVFIHHETNELQRMSENRLVTLSDGRITEANLVQIGSNESHWEEEESFSSSDEFLDVVRWMKPLILRNRDGSFKSFWNDDSENQVITESEALSMLSKLSAQELLNEFAKRERLDHALMTSLMNQEHREGQNQIYEALIAQIEGRKAVLLKQKEKITAGRKVSHATA